MTLGMNELINKIYSSGIILKDLFYEHYKSKCELQQNQFEVPNNKTNYDSNE